MAKAIAMSQSQDLGWEQETGVIGPGGQETNAQFGPATREHYDASKWAVALAGPTTQEIIPDPEPAERKNVDGQPRFLRQLTSGDYTPNFLTICHSIPAAREAFLLRKHVQHNYGQDSEWWKGHSISLPKVVHIADGSPAEPDATASDELLAEVQRLMAALDASDRSYISAEALAKGEAIQAANPMLSSSKTLLGGIVKLWEKAAAKRTDDLDVAQMFHSTIGTTALEGMDTPDLHVLSETVNVAPGQQLPLAEILDELLWETGPSSNSQTDNYIERPADVLTLRLTQQNTSGDGKLQVVVPPEFHVDKYLQENVTATRGIRQQMADGKKRITKLDQIEKKLKYWKHPSKNEQMDASKLLEHSIGHFSGKHWKDANVHSEQDPPHYADIAKRLEAVARNIDAKLKQLEDEKENTRLMISKLSVPPPELRKHRYTLRGVATTPQVTYLLQPKSEDDEDAMQLDADDPTPPGMQWWRIELDANASLDKIRKSPHPADDVIRAVELEHSSALLVYASDRACEALPLEAQALPPPLQDFVKTDNAFFAAELQAPTYVPPSYTQDLVRPSIERSSMDSTRAEVGEQEVSPPPYEHDQFFEHAAYGLPPDVKRDYDDEPVAEITLDEPEEMTERVNAPMLGRARRGSDSTMADAGSQDLGLGGAEHVERAED